jgi:hypothetical protein
LTSDRLTEAGENKQYHQYTTVGFRGVFLIQSSGFPFMASAGWVQEFKKRHVRQRSVTRGTMPRLKK